MKETKARIKLIAKDLGTQSTASLTKRQHFAALAMGNLLSIKGNEYNLDYVVKTAVNTAEKLLLELSK